MRSCFLILFVICMEGVPVVENPGSSLIWLHDRFQWLLTLLERAGLKDIYSKICIICGETCPKAA